MVKIAPSLLSCDFKHMGRDLCDIKEAGADWAHLDIMDGVFVTNISFGLPVIASVRQATDLFFDVHLMIVEPERYIDRFAKAGADLICVHYEACKDVANALAMIRATGTKVGLAIKPATPAEVVYPYLDSVDMILVMTVEPGYGGQALIPECLEKVSQIRAYAKEQGKELLIQVDGGINANTAKDAIRAGADVLVAGSAVFGAADRAAMIRQLREG